MKISYGITVHNEAEELKRLLEILYKTINDTDEVVVCVDGNDDAVRFELDVYARKFSDSYKSIKVYQRKLNGNFSNQKNSVIENSTGNYIFHIDADEYPNEILLSQLKQIIEMNEGVDLIWIPRVNTIEGMQQHHIQKWGWKVSEKGWVNYPDYQARVFRNDKSIRWTRPLHEYISGCKTYAHLPPQEELSLYHPKTIEKQEKQNMFYNQNFSAEMNVRGADEIKKKDKFEPISLEYFLSMEFATGGGGKEIITQEGNLKTVGDVLQFYSNKQNLNFYKSTLTPKNWQYFNCMIGEFRKNVGDHHELGWGNMTEEYYNSLEKMSDDEITTFLKENPVEFDNGFIKHSYHRACAMLGRLISGKSYIPFYMKEEKIYNVPWENDNLIRATNPLLNLKSIEQLQQLNKSQYCLTQSSILAIMGIRQNDDLDIIISSKLRSDLNMTNEYRKVGNVEIFSPNYEKFMINGATSDDDIIQNYTFEFEGYKFLEPRFYFSRKNKATIKDKSDWQGIRNFFEMESYKGYPFNKLTDEQWGVEYL